MKNDCEARSYDFKRRIDEDLATFTPSGVKTQIVQYCEMLIEWVYGEGAETGHKE
jgi:hypothetical protein